MLFSLCLEYPHVSLILALDNKLLNSDSTIKKFSLIQPTFYSVNGYLPDATDTAINKSDVAPGFMKF